MRGMILAAGRGERMRPLTLERPKPCLPIVGRPLILFALNLLARSGVEEAVVNLHHLEGQVRELLGDGSQWGMRIRYSPEPELLGTGGGIRRAREHLVDPADAAAPFVVVNSDTILRADLKDAVAFHVETGALATMVVTRQASVERYGAVRFDAEGRVVDVAGLAGSGDKAAQAAVFAGVHVMSPGIFERLPDREAFCIVREVLVPLIRQGEDVRAYVADGTWIDAGEPADYLAANRRVLEEALADQRRGGPFKALLGRCRSFAGDVFVGPLARVDLGVRYRGPVVIGERARVASGASLGPHVVLGRGSTVGRNARLSETVVWDGAGVEEDADLSGCVVTPRGVLAVNGSEIGS